MAFSAHPHPAPCIEYLILTMTFLIFKSSFFFFDCILILFHVYFLTFLLLPLFPFHPIFCLGLCLSSWRIFSNVYNSWPDFLVIFLTALLLCNSLTI